MVDWNGEQITYKCGEFLHNFLSFSKSEILPSVDHDFEEQFLSTTIWIKKASRQNLSKLSKIVTLFLPGRYKKPTNDFLHLPDFEILFKLKSKHYIFLLIAM